MPLWPRHRRPHRQDPMHHGPGRFVHWLAAGLGICTAGLLAAALLPFSAVRDRLDALAGDGSADPYSQTVHLRLQLMAAFLALLALFGAVLLVRHRQVCAQWIALARRRAGLEVQELRRGLGSAVWQMRYELTAISAVGAGLRLLYLHQPMRFDEAYTWLQYARWPWYIAISRYDDPNNHVFHTLCVNVLTRIFGNSPAVIRLPALTAGVLMIPAGMLWTRAMAGRTAAILAGAFLACSSVLVEYSTNARGYTMIGLATILSALLGRRVMKGSQPMSWTLLAAVLALGCWTVPVMLYPIFVLYAWWGLCLLFVPDAIPDRRRFALAAAAALLASAGLTLLLYVPVIITRGLSAFVGEGAGDRRTFGEVLGGFSEMVPDSLALFFRDQNAIGLAIGAMGVALSLTLGHPQVRLERRCAWGAVLLVLLLPLVQGVVPFPRVWLFLLPWMALLSAAGLAEGIGKLSPAAGWGASVLIVAMTAGAPAVRMIAQQSVPNSLETGAAPDAAAIARNLPQWTVPGEPVVAIVPVSAPLVYYARRQGLDDGHFAPRFWEDGPVDSAIVVVSKTHGQTIEEVLQPFSLVDELTPGTTDVIAEFPRAIVYRVAARRGRRGASNDEGHPSAAYRLPPADRRIRASRGPL